MRKKLQKYLSGEREGFSLVELIIVIAIMAILVGVVALAVIPNIEKSRESKDFATLDAVCSALNAAVASTQATSSGVFELPTSAPASPATEIDKVKAGVIENLGDGAKTLTSSNASDAKIMCSYDVSTGKIEVYASTDGSDGNAGTVVKCKYNDQKDLKVTN